MSPTTVMNIIKGTGKKRESEEKGEIYKKHQPKKKVSPKVLKTITNYASRENVPTQSFIAAKAGVSQPTVCRVIHNDLVMKTRKKRKVHVLNLKEQKNRMSNCIKLYKNHLAGDKCKFVVTLDESWIKLKFNGKTSEICYIKAGENIPEDWVKQEKTLWEKKFMVIAAMTYYGTLPLFKLPVKMTMNSSNYIDYVLRPLIHENLIPLFGDEIKNVFVHFDKSSVHSSEFTTLYMDLMTERYGIRFIKKDDIPVKDADCSPLDFFGFGYLKSKVETSGVKTLQGLWKKCCAEWLKVSPETCHNVYRSWKKRCRLIHQRLGSHVEQVKDIHKHKQRAIN